MTSKVLKKQLVTQKSYIAKKLKKCDFNNYKAAGILPYRFREGKMEFLFGYGNQKPNKTNNMYHILAGKIESYDNNFKETAFREFNEESGMWFTQNSKQKLFRILAQSPILWLSQCKMGIYLINVDTITNDDNDNELSLQNILDSSISHIINNLDKMYKHVQKDITITPFENLCWLSTDIIDVRDCHFVLKQCITRLKNFPNGSLL